MHDRMEAKGLKDSRGKGVTLASTYEGRRNARQNGNESLPRRRHRGKRLEDVTAGGCYLQRMVTVRGMGAMTVNGTRAVGGEETTERMHKRDKAYCKTIANHAGGMPRGHRSVSSHTVCWHGVYVVCMADVVARSACNPNYMC